MNIDWNKYFKYDENSPTCLLWIGSTSYRIKNGITPAGSLKFKKSGERRHAHVQLGDTVTLVHRIIWEMFHGEIPKDMIIDHKDGNPWNNKIENLRCVRQELNPRNARMRKDNTSGNTGVGWYAARKKHGMRTYAYASIEQDGKAVSSYFNVSNYGLLPAYKLAWLWRQKKLQELNLSGAGYTERHGKELNENQNH